MVTDEVWKLPAIVNRFLSYRAAIPLAQEQIGVMMSILKTREQSVESFLDLGCGDGILGAALLGEYPSARGVLADFSDPMLDQAREQLREYAGQLNFENLDYGDPAWVNRIQAFGPFDAIVSGYSIHHQADERKRSIYEEIFSLLKPGGWFINIEHVSSASQLNVDLFENHYTSARYTIEKQNGGMRTLEQIADEYKNRPDKAANILAPVELQCNWLREIGYEEVDCYFRIYELAVFAGRKPNRKSKIGNHLMAQFTTLTSRVMPLPVNDIDTDQIIPAQFLKVTDKNGLAEALFFHWRYNDDKSPKADFVLNKPESDGCQILLAGDNFGCGSSREHAPWALTASGFRAVVSTSFADIFRSNSLKNGLIPIIVDDETHKMLFDLIEEVPDAEFKVDLESQTLSFPNGFVTFSIDPFNKTCLLNGTDELGYIMSFEKEIAAFETSGRGD